jgi:hypothetical protein
MADNTNSFEAGFGIQETMTVGVGNQKMAEDLLSPETSTVASEDLSPVIEDEKKEEKKDPNPVQKTKAPDKQEEEEAKKASQSLRNFLYSEGEDDDEEEEEEEEAPEAKKKPVQTPIAEEEEEESEAPKGATQFQALAKDLADLGVFSLDEDEELNINNPEEFLERFNLEKQKGANEIITNFLGQFGEEYQQAFDAIFVKGVNPKDYFQTTEVISSFSDMDLTKEDNQKKVLRQALKDQGFDPEDIESEIDRIENYGDLEQVAQKHHKVLVKKEAKKLEQLEQESQRKLQEKAAIRNQYITNVQSILSEKVKEKEFDGIPLNPKLATELQDFLLVDKWKTPSGETLSDFDKAILDLKQPQNHAMKVKVALLLKTLEKDPTLSSIQRKGKTKSNEQLFGNLANQVVSSTNKSSDKKPVANRWFK